MAYTAPGIQKIVYSEITSSLKNPAITTADQPSETFKISNIASKTFENVVSNPSQHLEIKYYENHQDLPHASSGTLAIGTSIVSSKKSANPFPFITSVSKHELELKSFKNNKDDCEISRKSKSYKVVQKEVEKSEVELEANRQGFIYNEDLMVYINEEGEGKVAEEFTRELEEKKSPKFHPVESDCEISRKSKSAKYIHTSNAYNPPQDPLEKEKISLITKHFLNLDVWLEGLTDAEWQISREGGFAVAPNGDIFPLEKLLDRFYPKKKRFLSYLESYGFHYVEATETIFNGKTPATFEAVNKVCKDFLSDYFEKKREIPVDQIKESYVACLNKDSSFPDFKEVKSGLKPLMQYSNFVKVLVNKGYHINPEEGLVLNPKGEVALRLEDLYDCWTEQREQTLLKFEEYGFSYNVETDQYKKGQEIFTLDQLYDTMKSSILKVVVDSAEKRLYVEYDPLSKCFKNGLLTLTTKEVLLKIMLMDFGL